MNHNYEQSPLYPDTGSQAKKSRSQSYSEGAFDQYNPEDPMHQQNIDPRTRPRTNSATYRPSNPNYKGNHYDPFFSAKKAAAATSARGDNPPRGPSNFKSPPPPKLMATQAQPGPKTPVLDPKAQLQSSLAWVKVVLTGYLHNLNIEGDSQKWVQALEPVCVYSGQNLVKLGLKAALKDETKAPSPSSKAYVSDDEFYSKLQDEVDPPSTSFNMF